VVNVGPLTAESGFVSLWYPSKLQRVSIASWLRYCSDVAQRKSTKLCTVFGRLLGWYNTYIFGGSCPLSEFYQVQYSLCVQVLRSPVLAALLHGTAALGVSQTLRHGTRNMELSLLIIFIRGRHQYSEGDHHVGHMPTL